MGLISILPEIGPFPLEDTQGVSLAVSILRRSLDKGRYRGQPCSLRRFEGEEAVEAEEEVRVAEEMELEKGRGLNYCTSRSHPCSSSVML